VELARGVGISIGEMAQAAQPVAIPNIMIQVSSWCRLVKISATSMRIELVSTTSAAPNAAIIELCLMVE